MKNEISRLQKEYVDRIQEDFWPYWQQYDDPIFGGILNCIDNMGTTLVSEQKFTWSQGRYLWLLAEMLEAKRNGLLPLLNEGTLQSQLTRCRDFLIQNAFYQQGICYYLLDRDGSPIPEASTGNMAASIFSDCFVLIGLANAQRVCPDDRLGNTISVLFRSIIGRVQSGAFLTEPYPIPENYRSHSIPMILINVSCEYLKLLNALEPPQEDTAFAREALEECLRQVFTYHVDEQLGLVREFVSTPERFETHLQDRHINPGHTLENIWFILEGYALLGKPNKKTDLLCTLAKRAYDIGWDKQHGGLLRFVDKDGGPPRGEKTGEAFENLILETWSMKIWWPHAEMLYTFLRLYSLTRDEELLAIYRQVEEYIFRVFPDAKHGEWIQIRNREGVPEEKLVALPVKDPFHILRAFLRIIQIPSL
jgi:N-acylglucosamine 2-epimerase